MLGPDTQIAVFWDNARIHTSNVVKAGVADPALNIQLIQNPKYRPDLNGVEFFWYRCKRHYRREIQVAKAYNQTVVNMTLVQNIIYRVKQDREFVAGCITRGKENFLSAQPTEPSAYQPTRLPVALRGPWLNEQPVSRRRDHTQVLLDSGERRQRASTRIQKMRSEQRNE